MDWSLRACARKGHVTYAPAEPGLRERLHVTTPVGEAWRCLRCGEFVLGAPAGSGPASEAPTVLRGRALRDALVLRVLAVERAVRALVLGAVGYAVIRFESAETSLQQLFARELPRFRTIAQALNFDLDKSPTFGHIRDFLHSKPETLHLIAAFLFGYALIELVEAVGLWSLQRWGEYVAAVATSVFLPFEVYELTKHVTYFKVAALVVNVLLVVYLVVAKRLFGVRGGGAAYEAARREESVLEVETAAGPSHTEAVTG